MRPSSLPNLITLARLAAVPLIAWLARSPGTPGLAAGAALFAIAAASDWLDGIIARRLDARTRLGTLLDPLVDKVMVLSVLFVFAQQGLVPLWLVLVNMSRELLASAFRQKLTTPERAMGANWMGKAKFVLQVAVVELIFLHRMLAAAGRALPGGTRLLFWALLAATAVSLALLANFVRWHARELFGPDGNRRMP